MRVFVFEYVTGGGIADSPMVASLAAEGDLMLSALVRDLAAIKDVEVLICRDRRLEMPQMDAEVHWVDGDWRSVWSWCLTSCDAVIPIAPETGGVLESLCSAVEVSGKCLLNSSSAAVGLAADKQKTLDTLAAASVPVVPSWRAVEPLREDCTTLVVKPDMGVGCKDIHLLRGKAALDDFLINQVDPSRWLVQPYVEGKAASLSLLVGEDYVCLLSCNVQRVAQVDDGFMLLGCVVNGLEQAGDEFKTMAREICQAMPGLWGYVGIDFVLTESGPLFLEVNPRLTTSYAGLSRSTGINVAELLVRLIDEPTVLPPQSICRECVHVDLELGRVA